jgi:post-segregation antitoxin (ccd killing protein)
MSEGESNTSDKEILSGREYLERLGQEYASYKEFLPGLSDEAFKYQQQVNSRRGMGVESFLADFALAAEERRRNVLRWQMGEKLPSATSEKLNAVQATLPQCYQGFSKPCMG